MPQRQATKRLSTAEVQGEDSYAVVRRIDLGEAKSLFVRSRQKTFDLQASLAATLKKYDEGGPPESESDQYAVNARNAQRGGVLYLRVLEAVDQARSNADDLDEMAQVLKLLATHVLEWNWVDDEGNPLPLPKNDPTVMDHLTDVEVRTLSNALRGPDQAAGKS